jgi:hypothetical protein
MAWMKAPPPEGETLLDQILRRLKNHPLGIIAIAVTSIVGWIGWDHLPWPTRNPECRYLVVEPFYNPDGSFDADLIGRNREAMFLLEHAAAFRPLGDFRKIQVVSLKSYDAGAYDFAVAAGVNQRETGGDLPKGFHSSQTWRGRLPLSTESYYLVTINPDYTNYRVRGSADGIVSVKIISARDARRYTDSFGVTFPKCESLKAGIH